MIRTAAIVAGVAVLGGLIWIIRQDQARAAYLSAEVAHWERVAGQRDRLNANHGQLAGALDQAGDRAALARAAQRAAMLRGQVDRMRMRLRNLRIQDGAASAQRQDAVWPDGATVWTAKAWKDAGQGTPVDLLQSALWAATGGDTDRLVGLIAFEPDARAKAQALFDGLPESGRADYGTPEKVVATLIAADMPSDYQAAAETSEKFSGPNDSVALTILRVEQASGQQSDLTFRTEKTDAGWKLDVPVGVIERFASKLDRPRGTMRCAFRRRTLRR